MHVGRVRIEGLRALRKRDDILVPEGAFSSAVCVRGLNGSGKTTYLEALAQLWQWFRRCQKRRAWSPPAAGLLGEAELVAARFDGLPGPMPSAWIAWGRGRVLAAFLDEVGPDPVAWSEKGPRWDADFLEWWDVAGARAEHGQGSLPNLVWIEAENKVVPALRKGQLQEPGGGWAALPVARYVPNARGADHLEGLLGTLALVDPERWSGLCRWLSELLPGMESAGFDPDRRPLLRLRATGELLTVDRLSAGERSVLINLAMMHRWLGPGGVVLVDEPELHQHLSLMRGSVAVMEAVARAGGGQLIVASHAPEVWDHFRGRGLLVELDGEPA